MFELGKLHNFGIVPQDDKSKQTSRSKFGEDAMNSIIEAARSKGTNKSQNLQSNVEIKHNTNNKTREQMAKEGIKQFRQNIQELQDALGIPDNILPESSVVVKKDGTEESICFSEDGQYKITILTQKDGSTKQIYSKLSDYEADGSPIYKDFGDWQTIKHEMLNPTTGEIQYYWEYRETNHLTGNGFATN